MSDVKEYVVTTPNRETTNSIWEDLTIETNNIINIPNREVEVANIREINDRNTSYFLTAEEAENLKKDPRVEDVFEVDLASPFKYAFQESLFDKTTDQTGTRVNWGLLRHINTTNVFGSSTTDPGGSYDYVLDGTGVDIVVIDSGIQANHPEFQDAQGNSRVQEINWYSVSGVSGTMPENFYTDYDGHGTHVAATIAGKTYGWAKNARIYSIKLDGLKGAADPGNGISAADAFDVILGWHNSKSGSRPTILNNSWGYSIFWHTNQNALSFSPTSGTFYSITGGSYRGTPWSGSTKDTSKGHTGSQQSANVFAFPYPVTSVDADVALLVSAGVIVCNAAGNDSLKLDIVGGVDYNNTITANTIGNFFYHRPGSPSVRSNPGFEVGSFGSTVTSGLDTKSSFSNSGPGVTIWAAGSRIMSAMSETNDDASANPYYLNNSFKQQWLSGTSMACPQVAGICALLMQAHKDWTPFQVQRWMIDKAQPQIYSTNLDNDYTVTSSIHGGYNRLAYFPMNGRNVFSYAGGV